MSSLLEEAIVDAKALKEAALKNAENAVLEKYSIEVKDALSTLLEQDEFGFDDGVTPADASFTDEVPFAFQNEELEAPPENELIEIDFDALKARIAEEEDQGMEAAPEELMSSEEMALQLEQETDTADTFLDPGEASGDPETAGETAEDMASTGSAEDAAAEEASHAIQDNPKNALEESDDEDIALTEEMLSDLIEELVVDMTPRPQGWSAEGSAYNSIIQANDEAMASAQGAHLEEEEIEEDVDTAPDVVSDAELYEAKIAQLTESTKEFRALLIEAKNQLTKLNLDNAKLVYQNKALNSASLNERQKHKIVEAVQSANSVEEANMIFETIQNAVGISDSKNNSRPQTLREAVQRPVSLLLNSKKNNEATHDPKLDRMLRLAGLNK